MVSTLTTIIIFIVVLGFLILIHEGGHFFAARWARVWVHEFAIGFGPAVWKRKAKETLYAIRLFPLGGYVRMAGETEPAPASDKKSASGQDEANVPAGRMFSSKSPWVRMGIIFAGPLTNVAAAIALMIMVVAFFGAPHVEVVNFTADDTPAARALQPGDIIASMNGTSIYSTAQIQAIVGSYGERPLSVEVIRNGQTIQIEITPRWVPEQGSFLIGAYFSTAQTNLITRIEKDSYLAQQGVKKGDRLVALDDIPITSARTLFQALEALQENDDSTTLTVQRGPETEMIALDLNEHSVETVFGGLSLETPTRRLGVLKSFGVGFDQTVSMATAWIQGIKRIITGELDAGQALSGPVGIANILGQGFEQGWSTFFFLVAFLSLNLGIINLFPFPALDGSRLVFITIELVRGKPISPEREGMVHQVGFILLLGLIVLITFNDIVKLFQ